VADLRHQKRGDLADRLEAVAHELLDALPAKIKDAPLNQLAVALGILIDKLILLRRQSATPAGGELGDEERIARLRQLAERVRHRRAQAAQGSAADAGPRPGVNGAIPGASDGPELAHPPDYPRPVRAGLSDPSIP
jgi:hypothetical protein